jgi:hypothetical protein
MTSHADPLASASVPPGSCWRATMRRTCWLAWRRRPFTSMCVCMGAPREGATLTPANIDQHHESHAHSHRGARGRRCDPFESVVTSPPCPCVCPRWCLQGSGGAGGAGTGGEGRGLALNVASPGVSGRRSNGGGLRGCALRSFMNHETWSVRSGLAQGVTSIVFRCL